VNSLYIASTEGGGGKTTLAVGLCLAFRSRGVDAGYFKPVGVAEQGQYDDDAVFAADVLHLSETPADLCPVVLHDNALRAAGGGAQDDAMDRVVEAFARTAAGHDVVVCEGLGEIWQGRFLRLSGADVVTRLDLRALLVAKFAGTRQLDDVCYTHDVLRKRLLGVVFSMVPQTRIEVVEHHYTPFLAENGIASYGILPSDPQLLAVPVGDIAAALNGRFVVGEEWSGTLAESYLIGAMSAEHALSYFERAPDKVVVVGGDREDLILAALQTPTAALVLTGSYVPSQAVLGRAADARVPVISVEGDTVAAADGLRRLFGHLRVHEHSKIDRIGQLVEEHVGVDALLGALQ
jgi:BioD-like phosphotransacetylase family protein